MFSAIRHQCLVVAPVKAIEKFLEGSGPFDPYIIAEGFIEDFDYRNESRIFVFTCRLNLFPGRS